MFHPGPAIRPRAVSLAILASLSASVALAQTAPQTLPPMVVQGTTLPDERNESDEQAEEALDRVPGGTSLVTEDFIERTRAADLQDVLQFTPGVLVRYRGTGEEPQLSIRGSALRNNFHTRGINILMDGFPFQNADGFSDVESFEYLSLQRVEVYRGANALRYGGNTIGGAINFVTKTGESAPPLGIRAEGGSFGFVKSYAETGQTFGATDLFGGASYTAQDGWRENAKQHRERVYGSAGHRFAGGASLRLDLNYVHNNQDIPGPLSLEQFEDDPRQANAEYDLQRAARDYDWGRSALSARIPLSEETLLEWQGQFNYQDLWHPLPFAIIDNETSNGTSEARLVTLASLFGLPNRFVAGFQLLGTRQPERFHANLSGEEGPTFVDRVNGAWTTALYLENLLEVVPGVELVLGARGQYAWRGTHDLSDGDADDRVSFLSFVPRVGVVWSVQPTLQLFANVSQTVEPPLLFELASPGNLGGNFKDLDEQSAWQFEIGTRGSFGERVHFDVALYDLELRNEILNVNVAPFPGAPFTIPRYRNTPHSRHSGVEVGLDATLLEDVLAGSDLPGRLDVDVASAYTYSRFVFRDDPVYQNNEIPGAPANYARAELRFRHSSGFWIAPGIELTPDGYFVDSANTTTTPAYFLVDLRLGFQSEDSPFGVFFEGRNLADRKYVSAVVVDAGDGAFYEPGNGRAFYGGVSWRWR